MPLLQSCFENKSKKQAQEPEKMKHLHKIGDVDDIQETALIPTDEYESRLPDLIPDIIPDQKKPLEEPYSKNDEEDLDKDDLDEDDY